MATQMDSTTPPIYYLTNIFNPTQVSKDFLWQLLIKKKKKIVLSTEFAEQLPAPKAMCLTYVSFKKIVFSSFTK